MENIKIMPVTAFQQNCSLIWDKNNIAVAIDPGGNFPKLKQFIDEHQLKLQAVLLTHGHLDHVGAAQAMKQAYNIPILGSHIADTPLFESLNWQSRHFGLMEVDNFLPDHWVEEGESIEFGELKFDVLYLPGHTPGHVGFMDYANNIGFTGDVLFPNSIGRTDLPGGNHHQLLRSIREKLLTLNEDFIIMPGHGHYTTVGQEKKNNPFLLQ